MKSEKAGGGPPVLVIKVSSFAVVFLQHDDTITSNHLPIALRYFNWPGYNRTIFYGLHTTKLKWIFFSIGFI